MASSEKAQQTAAAETSSEEWQKDVIGRLAFAALHEQKRARRWGIFFKLLTFAYIAAILYLYTPDVDLEKGASDKHTALVELKGIIHTTVGKVTVPPPAHTDRLEVWIFANMFGDCLCYFEGGDGV